MLAGVIIFARPARGEGISAGFIWDRYELTLEKGVRTEAAGPFFYSQASESNSVWAIPPFFSSERDPVTDLEVDQFLYPLMTRTRYGTERRWQFFELLNTESGQHAADTNANFTQFTLFPIYFQQRSTDTNLNYTAVVPFYGHLQKRLFRDEISFVMMPFYVETRKRDLVTDNYFWPFYDIHHANGLTGWQFWPFVGHEHKVLTTETNGYGVTTIPGHDHTFYMWPIYFWQNNGIGGDNPEQYRAFIPAYAYSRSPQRDVTTVLWPLFSVIDDRNLKYHEWQGPWPFVIFTHGEGKTTQRVWPLFSQSHNKTRENNSYLWPLFVHTGLHSDPIDQNRDRVLFYLWDRLSLRNTVTGKERVRVDMWPLLTWHRDFNGNERLQLIAPLEPSVPDNPGIERNWSPVWSLWRSESSPRAHASSQSLLWNLYRHESAPEHQERSILFGLYQSHTDTNESTVRLFYIPLAHNRK